MAASTHLCFSRQTLVDFQLGKLSQDRITRIYAESSVCPHCRRQLAALDDIADPMLAVLQRLASHDELPPDAGALSSGGMA